MNNLGRILLLVGGLVLALLIGVLIGRGDKATPTSESANTTVQITTAPPPSAPPPAPLPAPLPAPVVKAPPPAPIPKIEPDLQVQEDAAAVGMTTQDAPEPGAADEAPASTSAAAGAEEPIT